MAAVQLWRRLIQVMRCVPAQPPVIVVDNMRIDGHEAAM